MVTGFGINAVLNFAPRTLRNVASDQFIPDGLLRALIASLSLLSESPAGLRRPLAISGLLRCREANSNKADTMAMRWLKAFAGYLAPIFLILSPILSYSDQALAMRRNKSSAGFSLDIPLIMLVASLFK